MHNQKDVNESSMKPEIIEFYNDTTGGVDTFDKMVHAYSVSRCTRRWLLRMFYGILDQAGINALILYKLANPSKKLRKKEFLKNLVNELFKPEMERRLNKNLPRQLAEDISNYLGKKRLSLDSKRHNIFQLNC